MPIESSLKLDPKTRQWGIEPDFDAFIPYWLTIDPPNQQITVPAGAQTPGYAMSYRFDGPFVGHYLFYTTDYDDLLIRLTDGRDGYVYTMRGTAVHLRTIASNQPGFPAILPEHLVLQHRSHIVLTAQNLDAQEDASFRLMVQGYAIEPSRIRTTRMRKKVTSTLGRMKLMRPHFAPLDDQKAQVSNGQTGRYYLTTDDAGYFEIFKLNAIAYETGTLTELTAAQRRDILVQLFDYNGRQMTNAATPDLPLEVLAGTGANPNIWPARIMLPPKVQLVVEITNNSGVDADIYLTYIGRRIYAPDIYTPPSRERREGE